jgi:hypothetical protein
MPAPDTVPVTRLGSFSFPQCLGGRGGRSESSVSAGNSSVHPCDEELVSDGQDDCSNEKPDKTHRNKPAENANKNYRHRNRATASQQNRFQDVVDDAHKDAPDQEHHGMARRETCEGEKHRWHQHQGAYL